MSLIYDILGGDQKLNYKFKHLNLTKYINTTIDYYQLTIS